MGAETVTLKSVDPAVTVTALLDEAGANITGGYGSWDTIARPRRQAVTHWTGRDPFTMDLALILDGHKTFESVETQCSRLERLALPHPNPGGSPPVVSLNGEAIPHSDIQDWVVNDIAWGDNIRDRNGHRTRQHVVVGLLRYVEIDKIQITAAANFRNKSGGGTIRIIDVRPNDTMATIAARELGNSKRWTEIRELNPPLRDPNALVKISKIKVPPKKTKK